jgi:hypothetical protein
VRSQQASERTKAIRYPFGSAVVHQVDVGFLNGPWRTSGITTLKLGLQRQPCIWDRSQCDFLTRQSAEANCMTTDPTNVSALRIFQSQPVVVAVYEYFEHCYLLWCTPRRGLGSGVAFSNASPRARVQKKNGCKKPHHKRTQGGVFETGSRYGAYLTTDSSGLFAQRSLRWRFEAPVRIGPATSRSRFTRDAEERISDTRVLCVVVVTHLGITVFVAAETRARPVHRQAKVTGVRRPARINAR